MTSNYHNLQSNNEFAGPLAQALSIDVHWNCCGEDDSFDEHVISTDLRNLSLATHTSEWRHRLDSPTLVKPSFSIHGMTANETANANVFLNAVKLVIDSPATGR